MAKDKMLVAAVCPQCGASVDVDKNLEKAFCVYCGTKILIKSNTIKMKLDKSKELENLYVLARRAKKSDKIAESLKYYEMILFEDPMNWEPVFYIMYYKMIDLNISDIKDSHIEDFCNCLETVIDLIAENDDANDAEKNVLEVIEKTRQLLRIYNEQSIEEYKVSELNYYKKNQLILLKHLNNLSYCKEIYLKLGDIIEYNFSKNRVLLDKVINLWDTGIYILKFIYENEVDEDLLEELNEYFDKIKKYKPNYKKPEIYENPDATIEAKEKEEAYEILAFFGIVILILFLISVFSNS